MYVSDEVDKSQLDKLDNLSLDHLYGRVHVEGDVGHFRQIAVSVRHA
jgi:hypothetical protein